MSDLNNWKRASSRWKRLLKIPSPIKRTARICLKGWMPFCASGIDLSKDHKNNSVLVESIASTAFRTRFEAHEPTLSELRAKLKEAELRISRLEEHLS